MNIEEMIALFQKPIPLEVRFRTGEEWHSVSTGLPLMEIVNMIGYPVPAVKTMEGVTELLTQRLWGRLRAEIPQAGGQSGTENRHPPASGEILVDMNPLYRYLDACGVIRFDESKEGSLISLSEKGRKVYEESALSELKRLSAGK